jgi:hypothetical protein
MRFIVSIEPEHTPKMWVLTSRSAEENRKLRPDSGVQFIG